MISTMIYKLKKREVLGVASVVVVNNDDHDDNDDHLMMMMITCTSPQAPPQSVAEGKGSAKHLFGLHHTNHSLVNPFFRVIAMKMNKVSPMAATPSDSACFVSSKVSLKLQPDT